MSQQSAITRLRKLGPAFRGSDASMAFDWSSKTTSQYMYLWKQQGLITPLGGHSDVYVNSMLHPNINWESAILMAMPRAVLVGLEVLREHGWITQIPTLRDLVVPQGDSVFSVNHYKVQTRSHSWFARMIEAAGLEQTGNPEALPRLCPYLCLADMLLNEGWHQCGIGPDDVYWDELDVQRFFQATQALGVPAAQIEEANPWLEDKLEENSQQTPA